MKRAAGMARQIAVQTNTAIVMVKDRKTVRIPAAQLREEGRVMMSWRPVVAIDGVRIKLLPSMRC
jgi:hypothetical protein